MQTLLLQEIRLVWIRSKSLKSSICVIQEKVLPANFECVKCLSNFSLGDSSALNLEALEMVQEQAKCTEEQLKTKADKKDVDEIKEGLKELRREKDRDVEELRGRVSELEEAPKSFTVTLTEDRSERSRLKDNCSSDRKTKEIAVYNDHFGQNEAKLTDDLDK